MLFSRVTCLYLSLYCDSLFHPSLYCSQFPLSLRRNQYVVSKPWSQLLNERFSYQKVGDLFLYFLNRNLARKNLGMRIMDRYDVDEEVNPVGRHTTKNISRPCLHLLLYRNIILSDLYRNIKLTRDTHLMQQFIYCYKQLYMFRASICPSSGVLGCILIILLHMVSSTRCCG